jgi:predicted NBD/HSP70 family sugar kinase
LLCAKLNLMYLGIDIGGTKTLVGVLDGHGTIKERQKFATPQDYKQFLTELSQSLDKLIGKDFQAAGVGLPAVTLDRKRGVGLNFGNLPWEKVPVRSDIEKLVRCPVVIENDAKLAGLSEALLLSSYQRVLYVTISTGIGFALIVNGIIDTNVGDGGGRTILLEHEGRTVPWESFASGKAVVERYGKRAEEIHDAKTWQIIAHDIAVGLIEIIAMTEPEVIVIGGGVGHYLPRFARPLLEALKHYESPLLPIPPIRAAARPDEAVLYGCYDLARKVYGRAHSPAI